MKLKIGFPGRLLPKRKQNISYFLLRLKTFFAPLKFKLNPFAVGLLLLWLLVFLLGVCKTKAQQLTPVQIGEVVPDIAFNNLINYSAKTAKTSDFKGKLLIVDFWENWCHACVESALKVVELQKMFGDRVQIIAVSVQKEQTIAKIFRNNQYLRGLKLTIATDDKFFGNMFPHKTIPHIAWISPDGRYLGATAHDDLNAANINSLLSTGKVKFSEYKIDNLAFDPSKPMFSDSTAFGISYLFKSGFSGYQPGVPSQSGLQDMGGMLRMYGVNSDLFDLTCLSLSVLSQSFTPNRIIYADTSIHRRFKFDPLLRNRESVYCYEIIVPASRRTALYRIMHDDLTNATQIVAEIRRMPSQCYVIKANSDSVRLSNYLADDAQNKEKAKDGSRSFKWMVNLVSYLNKLPGMVPVIDESENNQKFDIYLPDGTPDFDSLNRTLRPFGFSVNKEERMLEMMYVSPQGYDPINISE
ncbi:MAG: TlpA disulfide reductase family protein [Ferruginibacter sp.]